MLEDIGYLYIIKDVKNTGWIKIGKTKDPIQRLRQYNSSFPEDRITYTFLSEAVYNLSNLENKLIEYLETRQNVIKSKNEWFKSVASARGKEALIQQIIREIETYYSSYIYYEDIG